MNKINKKAHKKSQSFISTAPYTPVDEQRQIRAIHRLKRQIRALEAVSYTGKRLLEKRKELDAIQGEIVKTHIALVYHWVKYFRQFPTFWNIDPEELTQDGCLGMLHALERYNPNRNCKFSSYATMWIKQYIRRHGYQLQRHSDVIVLSGDMSANESPDESRQIVDGDAAEQMVVAEERTHLKRTLRRLDRASRDVITATYGIERNAESTQVISKRMGMSAAKVRMTEKRALDVMRRDMIGDAI